MDCTRNGDKIIASYIMRSKCACMTILSVAYTASLASCLSFHTVLVFKKRSISHQVNSKPYKPQIKFTKEKETKQTQE